MSMDMAIVQEIWHEDSACSAFVEDPEAVLYKVLDGIEGWCIRERMCTCGCHDSHWRFWFDTAADEILAALRKRLSGIVTSPDDDHMLETDDAREKAFLENLISLIELMGDVENSHIRFS